MKRDNIPRILQLFGSKYIPAPDSPVGDQPVTPTPFPLTWEGSSTPPPLPGHSPSHRRMVSVGNVPPKLKSGESFNIVETYHRILGNGDLAMPIAAIEALVELLRETDAITISETLDLVTTQSAFLKSKIPNSISLSAGTDLFERFLLASLKNASIGDFEAVRQHLINNGKTFADRSRSARESIAKLGKNFVRDGNVVLTHGGSRVVGLLLEKAAALDRPGGNVRFKVIYVMNKAREAESKKVVQSLRALGIPVAEIPEGAVAYSMRLVNLVIVGAEGVVESGGIISRMGTYQIAQLAMAAKKPFYVAAETYKFVRRFVLGQSDIGIDQKVVDFKTEEEVAEEEARAGLDVGGSSGTVANIPVADAVDFTPAKYIASIVTENGIKTTSAVSEDLTLIFNA